MFGEREVPEARASLLAPTCKNRMSIGMVDSDCCSGEDNGACLGPVCGKDGITCPDIAARGREDADARVALATKRSGRPLATRTPIVGAREL